jgi:hypothetical protein
VPDVMMVRPSVSMTAAFTALPSAPHPGDRSRSRTRSKTTIVSFTE